MSDTTKSPTSRYKVSKFVPKADWDLDRLEDFFSTTHDDKTLSTSGPTDEEQSAVVTFKGFVRFDRDAAEYVPYLEVNATTDKESGGWTRSVFPTSAELSFLAEDTLKLTSFASRSVLLPTVGGAKCWELTLRKTGPATLVEGEDGVEDHAIPGAICLITCE